MEPVIADMINNPKVPRWVRYIIVTIVCGFAIFLGVMPAVKSPLLIGRLFGGALAALFLTAAVYLFIKIAKRS